MVEIAFARPDEREEVVRFMVNAFPRAKWSVEGWRRLLDGRWSAVQDRFAVTVRDAGALVGVLGMVTADRALGDRVVRTANMTSWYVLKPYRGQGVGQRMVDLATADPDVTVTNFSSAKGAVGVVRNAGLAVLDAERLIWHPAATARPLPVDRDPLSRGAAIGEGPMRVLRDHAGLNLTPVVVDTPDGPCVVILSIKQKSDDRVTHEVMYLSDQAVFVRHARRIADSLLPDGGAILSVDARFAPGDQSHDTTEAFAVPRFYTPGRMNPAAVDMLYSEIVLLDMKLY